MSNHACQTPRSPFALSERALARLEGWGLAPGGVVSTPRVIALCIALTWAPLLALTIASGMASEGRVVMAFFGDSLPHGRYWLALPLLLLMDRVVERRTKLAIDHLRNADLVAPDAAEQFTRTVAAATQASHSKIALWVLLIVVYATAAASFFLMRDSSVPSNWMFSDGRVTLAGAWNLFISAALMRFMLLRALWKFAVWSWLLLRLSRLRLQLDALHPDGRCGLRFLGETQLAFAPLVAAVGVQLGCVIADAVRVQGAAISSFELVGAAFVLGSIAMILGPLAIFARQAWLAIERAQDSFSTWGSLAARHMWMKVTEARSEHLSQQMSTSEISSMTDASALFDRVLAARPVPIDVRQIAIVAAAAIFSTLLPLLALLPLGDIARRLASVLL